MYKSKKLAKVVSLILTAFMLLVPTTVDASELSRQIVIGDTSGPTELAGHISKVARPVNPVKAIGPDLQVTYYYDEDCNLHIVIINTGTEPITVGGENNPNPIGVTEHDGTEGVLGSGNSPVTVLPGEEVVVFVIPAKLAARFAEIRVDPNGNIDETNEENNSIRLEPCDEEGGSGPTGPVIGCDAAAAANDQLVGEQCLSFIPNDSGGYDLHYYAYTDGDPQVQGNIHPFLGVECQTSKNGNRIERYEVEHVLGSQQGNFVEYGVFGGVFSQIGTTPIGNYQTLPESVPNDGATYERVCQHWAGFSLETTTVTVTLP